MQWKEKKKQNYHLSPQLVVYYLSINGKFLKKAYVLLTMKVTSKKQHRSFVENSMHKVNFCTFKSAAEVLKVLLAAGLQKKKNVNVFRYSFSEAIPIFSIALKVNLSLSDRYKIFTNDWLRIEIYQNVGFSKIDITMTTMNKKLWNW